MNIRNLMPNQISSTEKYVPNAFHFSKSALISSADTISTDTTNLIKTIMELNQSVINAVDHQIQSEKVLSESYATLRSASHRLKHSLNHITQSNLYILNLGTQLNEKDKQIAALKFKLAEVEQQKVTLEAHTSNLLVQNKELEQRGSKRKREEVLEAKLASITERNSVMAMQLGKEEDKTTLQTKEIQTLLAENAELKRKVNDYAERLATQQPAIENGNSDNDLPSFFKFPRFNDGKSFATQLEILREQDAVIPTIPMPVSGEDNADQTSQISHSIFNDGFGLFDSSDTHYDELCQNSHPRSLL